LGILEDRSAVFTREVVGKRAQGVMSRQKAKNERHYNLRRREVAQEVVTRSIPVEF